jgi:hypothetical protein
MGPDGKPWDPARRAQRQAERATQPEGMNSPQGGAVEGQTSSAESAEAPKE